MRTRVVGTLVFIGLFGCIALPLAVLFVWSFAPQWNFPQLLPNALNLSAWRQLANGKLGEATLNSFFIALVVAAISVAVGFPSGRLLSKRRSFSLQSIQILTLFPLLLPTAMLAIGVQFLFVQFNLSGTLAGVIAAHLIVTLPYSALVSVGIFSNFNFNYELQARTLGASAAQALWLITARALSSGAISVALFSFLISWSQFVLTIQLGAGRVQTLPMLVFAYLNGGNMQFAAASTVTLVLPTLLAAWLSHRTMQSFQAWQG